MDSSLTAFWLIGELDERGDLDNSKSCVYSEDNISYIMSVVFEIHEC